MLKCSCTQNTTDKLNTGVHYLKWSSLSEPKVLLSWLEINFEAYLRFSVDEQYPIGGVYKADSTSNLKGACGRRPWVLSKSSDLLGGRFWMLSHGTRAYEGICSTAPWHVSPGEPRCNTWATWSRSPFPPVTQSAYTTSCGDACRCVTISCSRAEEVNTSDVCREHVLS